LLKEQKLIRKPFKYDPELMEKARWITERGLHRPPEHEIERQPAPEPPVPMPSPEGALCHHDPCLGLIRALSPNANARATA
jgi:hypothetical protein